MFTPRVLAGIGSLPDTVEDRSIPIRLQRRAPHEPVEPFRFREASEVARPIREAFGRWALTAGEPLERARPELPPPLNDRATELWEPLLAIADLAGGEWPRRAREAALALHGDLLAQDETVGIALLRAFKETFDGHATDRITTAGFLAALVDRDDGPWAEWWGKAVADGNFRGPGSRLTKLLRPYGITSKTIRVGDERAKGYERSDFEDAFRRYAPSPSLQGRDNVTIFEPQGPAGQNEDVTHLSCHVLEIARQPLQGKECHVVTSSDARPGEVSQTDCADDPVLAEAIRRWGDPVEFRPHPWKDR